MADVRRDIPHGNEALQDLVMSSLSADLDWLEGFGVRSDDIDVDLPGWGRSVEPTELTAVLVDEIRDAGGRLHRRTAMTDLRMDDASRIVGVVATGPDGRRRTFDADAVVVTTGGF